MFIPDSMCGCSEEVMLNHREALRISLFEVHFKREAMILIGLGIKKLAAMHGLPEGIIKKHMNGNLFIAPPSQHLYFLFHVPEIDADMHIAVPPCHYDFVG
ncbi:hypothetical protein [Maridesulfovibrio sp.]|uniref:hypothetical protein n=1 Tax=Maridesulfovibrio sp. TaxID=2795000 RepID=UPI0029C9C664|nr:hypothetical protein [Maridesulfovibrio sp.]